MASQLIFKRQLPLINRGLSLLAASICLSGIVFIIKSDASELSIMTMLASLIIAITIYLFKLLVIGLSQCMLALSDEVSIKPTASVSQIKPVQKKVASFGLCSFCNRFETKNTLSSRYVCSDCYKIFLQVKQQALLNNISELSRVRKAS